WGNYMFSIEPQDGVDKPQMTVLTGTVNPASDQKYSFYAVESKSGDVIAGYTYDALGKYQDGQAIAFPSDEIGGNWTYHIESHTDAPSGVTAATVYDTNYYDAQTHTWGWT